MKGAFLPDSELECSDLDWCEPMDSCSSYRTSVNQLETPEAAMEPPLNTGVVPALSCLRYLHFFCLIDVENLPEAELNSPYSVDRIHLCNHLFDKSIYSSAFSFLVCSLKSHAMPTKSPPLPAPMPQDA